MGVQARNWGDTVVVHAVIPNENTRTIDVSISVIQQGRLKLRLTSNDFAIFEKVPGEDGDSVKLEIRELKGLPEFLSLDSIESPDELPANYLLKLEPGYEAYQGAPHLLVITPHPERNDLKFYAAQEFVFGTPSNAINFAQFQWKEFVFLGLLILAVLLALFSQLIPYLREQRFKKKFARKYRYLRQAHVTHYDPVTALPFEDDELVVAKCRTLTSYESWKHNNFQCVNYPGCLYEDPPCTDGEPSKVDYLFFKQRDFFRQLNWMWFGGLGGLLAWGLWAILKNINLTFLSQGLAYVASWFQLATSFDSLVYALTRDTLMGLCLGLGLGFALSWVEELGQSRKVSWGRIALRTALATLITPLLFILGFFLQHKLIHQEFLSGLATWALFGLFLGLVLSVRSTIGPGRGMLGGLVASLVAFNVYHWLSYFFQAFELAKMLSFILLGILLGLVMVSVVARLEDFELEYISPEKFRRSNPVGRWLKQRGNVFIGTDADCFVFIKWDDPLVQGKHARLNYQNGTVYLEALADTLVNRQLLRKGGRIALKNGDIIQLGQGSVSQMCFWERATGKVSSNYATPGSASPAPSGDFKKYRPKADIKISKRN